MVPKGVAHCVVLRGMWIRGQACQRATCQRAMLVARRVRSPGNAIAGPRTPGGGAERPLAAYLQKRKKSQGLECRGGHSERCCKGVARNTIAFHSISEISIKVDFLPSPPPPAGRCPASRRAGRHRHTSTTRTHSTRTAQPPPNRRYSLGPLRASSAAWPRRAPHSICAVHTYMHTPVALQKYRILPAILEVLLGVMISVPRTTPRIAGNFLYFCIASFGSVFLSKSKKKV